MSERFPAVKVREMIRILEKCGFTKRRQRGSHAYFSHPDGRSTTVPIHPGDLSRFTLKRILIQIEMSTDEIRKLL